MSRAEREQLGICKQCGREPAQKNRKFGAKCLRARSVRYFAAQHLARKARA